MYGDCGQKSASSDTPTKATVLLGIGGMQGERSYFCSRTHAALYLLSCDGFRQLASDVEHELTRNEEGRKRIRATR